MARAGEANGGAAAGERAVLPPEVEGVFREFCTCEFSTLARDPDHLAYGDPVTARGAHFVLTISIGMPQKAFNIRCDPRVSLLFSDPTASGLRRPPAVLVQG